MQNTTKNKRLIVRYRGNSVSVFKVRKMSNFWLCYFFLQAAVLPALIFKPGHINCFSLNEDSSGSHSSPNSPSKALCIGDRVYFNHTRKCYKEGSKGPCGERMVLSRPKLSPESEIGDCVCESACKGRPMVNVREKNRCYFIFEQGPCPPGQWLVPLEEDVAVCETIPCPDSYNLLPKPFNFQRPFLFSYEGRCYLTGVKGAGPCPEDETAYIFDVKHICTSSGFGCGDGGTLPGPNDCEDGNDPDEFGGCEPSTIL